jgi:hypothetical protein
MEMRVIGQDGCLGMLFGRGTSKVRIELLCGYCQSASHRYVAMQKWENSVGKGADPAGSMRWDSCLKCNDEAGKSL